MVIRKYIQKIFGIAWRKVDNTTFQQRALKKVDKIALGEKIIAPKHPTDQRIFEATLKNDSIKEEVNKKYDKLIEHMNKFTVKSTNPDISDRTFPTNFSLLKSGNPDESQTFEYGFYEPSNDKLEKDHLTFREALDILRARMEIEGNIVPNKSPTCVEENIAFLENHPATKRVSPEKLDRVWQYFRPFVRQDRQRVLLKKDVEDLKDILEAKTDFIDFYQNPKEMIRNLLKNQKASNEKMLSGDDRFEQIESEEEQKYVEAIQRKRKEDFDRLEKRLEEMSQLSEGDVVKTEDKKEIKNKSVN